MNEKENRYFDFSDDEWLQGEFDPDSVSDVAMKIHAVTIQKHLAIGNPVNSLRGLLACLHGVTAANTGAMIRELSHIKWLTTAAVGLLAYIAYQLT